MRVVMVVSREWQDGGRARVLDVGQTYELPDGVGADLIAMGAATPPDDAGDRAARPPETKPMIAPETKARSGP